MSTPSERTLTSEFAAVFRQQADAHCTMRFDQFMEIALYHESVGYYRRAQNRIGYQRGTDFFTASSTGSVFGELVVASCINLLGASSPTAYTFVEIGSETSEGVLAGVKHPFAGSRTFRIGEEITLTGKCIVFSNELFDAQPFRRFVFRNGQWNEVFVQLEGHQLVEVLKPTIAPNMFPQSCDEGYTIDAPLAAVTLEETLIKQRWSGLFVACDYGKSWRELAEACPAGTARAYHRHQQSNDLLARAGEQDLTCHVCWDWLCDALRSSDFSAVRVDSHEAFFIRNATAEIAAISNAEAHHLSARKMGLMQLLHPAHLGQKFQVLHALRT